MPSGLCRKVPPWPPGGRRPLCLFLAVLCVAAFELAYPALRSTSPPAFVGTHRPPLGGVEYAPRAGGERAQMARDRPPPRAGLARRCIGCSVLPGCCLGVVLLALSSRMLGRGTRRDPQRTTAKAARVVSVAASATPIIPGQKAALATAGARGQRSIHPNEAAAPVVEASEAAAPVASSPAAVARNLPVNTGASLQQMAVAGTRPRGHPRATAFMGSSAAMGAERRQRRRLGARLQRSAFAPCVESYDPSRLRTAIQAGQQRASNLRVANGREWEAPATSGSSVCMALSSTRSQCLVMVAEYRKDCSHTSQIQNRTRR